MSIEKMWDVTSALQRDEKFIELRRPCGCGCDEREGKKGVGYLIVSAGRKKGATIWIENEEVYRELEEVIDPVN